MWAFKPQWVSLCLMWTLIMKLPYTEAEVRFYSDVKSLIGLSLICVWRKRALNSTGCKNHCLLRGYFCFSRKCFGFYIFKTQLNSVNDMKGNNKLYQTQQSHCKGWYSFCITICTAQLNERHQTYKTINPSIYSKLNSRYVKHVIVSLQTFYLQLQKKQQGGNSNRCSQNKEN